MFMEKTKFVSNYINEYSESSNWRDLKSGKDFFLIPCADERIVNNTTLLVKYYLGKADEKEIFYLKQLLQLDTLPEYNNLCEDDIQVVTPLAKSTYLWGANNLNNVLQPLFNNVKDFNKTYIYQRSKDGTPIKCPYCKSSVLEDFNVDRMEYIVLEYDTRCAKCGKILGHWSYGHWNLW